jgi:hypothetical protein
MSETDLLARDIFLSWVEEVSGEYTSSESVELIAKNAVMAANVFMLELGKNNDSY